MPRQSFGLRGNGSFSPLRNRRVFFICDFKAKGKNEKAKKRYSPLSYQERGPGVR